MEEVLLSVSDLSVRFGGRKVLYDVSFDVKRGETVAVIGPNGAGKTVLFKALLSLVPYEGKVEWKRGVKIGYVPQRFALGADLPLTTEEFFGLKEKNKREVAEILAAVGFSEDGPHKEHLKRHVLKRRLGVLSGGELQRVLIAFALLGHPDVLLFDEPTTGVDVFGEETIYGLLHRLQEKENLTIILISHELHVVWKYSTNVICLNRKELCFGPPKEILDKETLSELFGSEAGIYVHHDHK